MKAIIDFFQPPVHDNIEQDQKARFLHYSLILTSVSLILLGIQNLGGSSNLDVILFSLSLLVAMCVPLNKRGYYYLVVIITSLAIIATITYSLMVGFGLMDAGILAYPIFILFTAFFSIPPQLRQRIALYHLCFLHLIFGTTRTI